MTSQDLIRIGSKLRQTIDFHAGPARSRHAGTETATIDSLVKRLALPDREHVVALIESGRLRSFGAVHKNDNGTGPHRFAVADLDGIKREVLAGIAEQVIEEYKGDPDDLPAAVSVAIAAYLKSAKEAKAVPTVLTGDAATIRAHVREDASAKGLARVLPAHARSFAYRDPREERPGMLRRVATGAAVAGGLYAGASYLRGRKIGARGLLSGFKAGNAANVADARKIAGRVAGFIRPRNFSAVTPAKVRALLLAHGRQVRARTA